MLSQLVKYKPRAWHDNSLMYNIWCTFNSSIIEDVFCNFGALRWNIRRHSWTRFHCETSKKRNKYRMSCWPRFKYLFIFGEHVFQHSCGYSTSLYVGKIRKYRVNSICARKVCIWTRLRRFQTFAFESSMLAAILFH